MAIITERINVDKITIKKYNGANWEWISDTEATGATFTLSSSGSKYGTTQTGTVQEADFHIPIEQSAYKSKRRLNETNTFITIKSSSLSSSGDFPPASRAAMNVSETGSFFWMDVISETYSNTLKRVSRSFSRTPYGSAGVEMGSTGEFYGNVNYTINASAVIYGLADSTRRPYAELYWADIIPKIDSPIPTSGSFVNEKENAQFSWAVNLEKTADGTTLSYTSKLKWRVKGSTTVHVIDCEPNSATVPANTFPDNSIIEYCVISTTSEGNSNTENWIEITTTDVIPDAPTNLAPDAIVINGNEPQIFSWSHNISTSSTQSKAELQYSVNNGASWNSLAVVNGSAQSTTIPADTLPSGVVMWRVRTFNTDNVSGDYSEAVQIVVKARPKAPTINNIDGKPFATVSWASQFQMGYRVVFVDSEGHVEDTGECYGTIKTYTSKSILADGNATVTIYVGNASGQWNSTTAEFTVQNVSGTALNVQTIRNEFSTTFNFDGEAYVTRNGELIGKGNGTFTDRSGNGRNFYNVIKTNNGYYTKSEDIEVNYVVKTAVVYDVESNGEFIPLHIRKESPVIIDRNISASVSYNNYCGLVDPVAYVSEYKAESINLAITRTVDDNALLKNLIGKLCCIKDKSGVSTYAVLNSISESIERWNDITLGFTKVDYESGVEYDA